MTTTTRSSVDVGGIRLNVAQAGPENGRPTMLLHGFPEFWWGWRHQIDRLASDGFRVLVPDMRGYGDSGIAGGPADYALDVLVGDIVGLADALGHKHFALVGHDWGGIVAWGVAARHPERVEKLVAMSAPHPETVAEQLVRHPSQILRSAYVGFFQLPLLPEAALSASRFLMLRRALTSTARPGTFDPDEIDRYMSAWSSPGRVTAMLNYYRALRHPSRPLDRIEVPTRILWGARDAALGVHLAHAAAEMCEEAEVLVHPDATHWLHHEEPAWVAEQIGAFCG